MVDQLFERRLAAIVAADVVGYSRLMGLDETGTLTRLKTLRQTLIEPMIARYNGRITRSGEAPEPVPGREIRLPPPWPDPSDHHRADCRNCAAVGHLVWQRFDEQGIGLRADHLFPHVGQYGGGNSQCGRRIARSAADVAREWVADLLAARIARRAAGDLWRAETERDFGGGGRGGGRVCRGQCGLGLSD